MLLHYSLLFLLYRWASWGSKWLGYLFKVKNFFSIVSIFYSTYTVNLFLYTPAQSELFFILFINNLFLLNSTRVGRGSMFSLQYPHDPVEFAFELIQIVSSIPHFASFEIFISKEFYFPSHTPVSKRGNGTLVTKMSSWGNLQKL